MSRLRVLYGILTKLTNPLRPKFGQKILFSGIKHWRIWSTDHPSEIRVPYVKGLMEMDHAQSLSPNTCARRPAVRTLTITKTTEDEPGTINVNNEDVEIDSRWVVSYFPKIFECFSATWMSKYVFVELVQSNISLNMYVMVATESQYCFKRTAEMSVKLISSLKLDIFPRPKLLGVLWDLKLWKTHPPLYVSKCIRMVRKHGGWLKLV